VALDLCDRQAVSAAVEAMTDLGSSFLLEKMVEGAVAEVIVGVARDEQFGPYLVVGAGGVLVELIKDSVPLLLPTDRETVIGALGGLRCAPLFRGFRGRPPADLSAAVEAILSIASLVEDDPAAIEALDVNPLLLLADGEGVVAVDGLIRMQEIPGGGWAADFDRLPAPWRESVQTGEREP
jgi:acetyl-CoA synthetase